MRPYIVFTVSSLITSLFALNRSLGQNASSAPVQSLPNALKVGVGALTFDGGEPNFVLSALYARKITTTLDIEAALQCFTSANVQEAANNKPLVNPAFSLSDPPVWGTYIRSLVSGELCIGIRPFNGPMRLVAGISLRHIVQTSVSEVLNQVPTWNYQTQRIVDVALWGSRYQEQWDVGGVAGVFYEIELSSSVSLSLYAKHHNYGKVSHSLTFSGGAVIGVGF